MKKDVLLEIKIPEEISVKQDGNVLIFKNSSEEVKKTMNEKFKTKLNENKITLERKNAGKSERKIIGTARAHIKNIIKGLTEKFTYKLQVLSVHFPTTVSIDNSTNELVVKNFLGEKIDRRIKLIPGADIKINKDIIEITASNKELAGQNAANMEKMTRVRKRDRRIFQDGIYIIEKPGRELI
jgi:large subunit ribosomal protein L6